VPVLDMVQIEDNVCVVVIVLLLEQCPVTFYVYIVKQNGLPIEEMTVDIKFSLVTEPAFSVSSQYQEKCAR